MTEEEYQKGIDLYFSGEGIYNCINCDWATNSEDDAELHRNEHLNSSLGKKLPQYKIGFWKRVLDESN